MYKNTERDNFQNILNIFIHISRLLNHNYTTKINLIYTSSTSNTHHLFLYLFFLTFYQFKNKNTFK